jgi:hypothetical protein
MVSVTKKAISIRMVNAFTQSNSPVKEAVEITYPAMFDLEPK